MVRSGTCFGWVDIHTSSKVLTVLDFRFDLKKKGFWFFVFLIWFDVGKNFDSLLPWFYLIEFLSICAWSLVFTFSSLLSFVFVFLLLSSLLVSFSLIWWLYCLFIDKLCAIYLKCPLSKVYFRKINMEMTWNTLS